MYIHVHSMIQHTHTHTHILYSGLFLRGVYFVNFEIAAIRGIILENHTHVPSVALTFCEIRKIYTP